MVSGSKIIAIIINKSAESKIIPLVIKNNLAKPNVLVASKQGSISGNTIRIQPEETIVIKWE
jgi:hypothetical protein